MVPRPSILSDCRVNRQLVSQVECQGPSHLSVQVTCPIRATSLVCSNPLSNLGQVTCLSTLLVQFWPRHLSVQVVYPIWAKSFVSFGPSHLRPSHLSNSGQVTCLSKSLVQFGPSHLSVQVTYPIWAKSLVCSCHLSKFCLLYTSPSPRDKRQSRMPSSA